LKIFTQNIGIDVAKDSFVACLSYLLFDREIKFVSVQSFKNSEAGFLAFSDWFMGHLVPEVDVCFTMEATGVYYERLAYYLFSENYQVSVVQPTQASNYKKSESQSSKTDKLDAKSLARMGLERKLVPWKPTSEYYMLLRDLTRERSALKTDQTRLKNQLHALIHSKYLHPVRKELIEERLGLIKSQL
ncbi:transposase, partial [uncultured Microscilla sp.]|uniref:IS110 family transposase n=1 Tax=uncultured Microscilla sp. TaxID=432653 RepID=UPI00261DAA99